MDLPVLLVLSIILLAVFFFIWGKVRSDIVALSVVVLLVVTGILTPGEGLSAFSTRVNMAFSL